MNKVLLFLLKIMPVQTQLYLYEFSRSGTFYFGYFAQFDDVVGIAYPDKGHGITWQSGKTGKLIIGEQSSQRSYSPCQPEELEKPLISP